MKLKTNAKFFAVLTMAVVLLAVCASAAGLKDIEKHWAKEYIEYGVEHGYISGYQDGTFLPDKTVTRAEFSKMINNAVKITSTGTAQANFSDVVKTEWYVTEVKKAENAGYITGYEDGTFRPNNTLTRQEAAVILSRIVLPTTEREDISSFKDGGTVDAWAQDAVAMIAAKGYIKGDDYKNFNPKSALTRSQAAKLIAEFVQNENIKNKNVSVVPSDNGKDIIYSDILFTDDIAIQIAKGVDVTVVFKNCRILGDLDIKTADAVVELENTQIKKAGIEADGVELSVDKASVVKAVEIDNACKITGKVGAVAIGDNLEGASVTLDDADTIEVEGDVIISLDTCGKMLVNKKSSLVIQSGTIKELEVTSTAKSSTINLAKKAVIEKATNKAAVSYVGSGTIEEADNKTSGVEFDGVTVDKTTGTKPSGEASTTKDEFFEDVEVTPTNKKTNVAVTSKIKFVFPEKVTNDKGKAVTAEYIEEEFELRRASATGTRTAFTASITSSKNILMTPGSDLKAGTKYYVVIPKGVLTYADGTKNEEYVTYFTTAKSDDDDEDTSDDEDVTVTFSPKNKDTASVGTEIKITFDTKVYRSASKSELTESYCESTAFQIRKGSSSGDEIDFTATVSSTGKVVTLAPDDMLEPDTKYYVIVVGGKLYDGNKNSISKTTSYFTTEDDIAVKISPENAATNVSTTPEIVIEFTETMLNYNGKALTGTDVEDGVVEIRKKTKTGDAIGFTAEVASGSKKITITPDELEVGTKYYIILLEESLLGKESKETNDEVVSYFTVAAASAPMITPDDGKKNVGVDTDIRVSFSGELYAAYATGDIKAKDKLTNANIAEYVDAKDVVVLRRNSSSGTVVKCDVTLEDNTIVLTPRTELAVNYSYYVVVKSSTLYVGGTSKKNAAATTTFSTNEALMPTFSPEDGEKNVEVDAALKITFDESIFNSEGDELTKNDVVNDVVRLYKKSNGEEVDFGAKVSGRVITITPSDDLEGGTEYVLAINSGSVKNSSDLANQSYSVTFKTESKVVKTVTCDPKNAATKVSIYVNPVVTFASPIFKSAGGDVTPKYAGNYILLKETKSNGTEVSCTVEVSDDFKEFTIIPDEPLEKNKKYYITIASGKFAYEDESSVSSKSFYFTTTNEEEANPNEPEPPVVECSFCGEAHEDEEHECSKCGELGHESARWCEDCETHTHDTADAHCEDCGLFGHEAGDAECPEYVAPEPEPGNGSGEPTGTPE